MKRPPWEVADIIRRAGNRFLDRCGKFLSWPQLKVLRAIERCRTAALGGHRDRCERCGHQAISYNSCRNRHCPKCQTNARNKWLTARQQELLPADYYHLVFSVPHALAPLIWQNKIVLFKLLFDASAATLLEVAADPKHLGAEIGFLGVLHTWGQTLQPHPHIHCVVPGGGLSPDHTKWIRAPNHFFLPVKVLRRVFRGKFVDGLKRAFRQDKLLFFGPCLPLVQERAFSAFLRTLFREDWVVYAKRPFGGPEHVLHYLARYTHRVAISNHRLVEMTDTHVSFRWKDYATSQQAPRDDPQPRGVFAPLSPACSASRISPHPLLRFTRQSAPGRTAPSLQDALTCTSGARSVNACHRLGSVQVPLLPRPNAPCRATHRKATPPEPRLPGGAP